MENKYYTPSIEEFFVGFEYEEENDLEDNVWIKRTLDFSYDWLEIHKDFANDKRVKYLDSSDIEELGFTVIKTKENAFEAVKKFTFTYDNYPSEGEYNIIVSGDKYCVIKLKDIGETTLFRGEIKNKNVLKQVFKMLDIK
jgi:hypothetical protein